MKSNKEDPELKDGDGDGEDFGLYTILIEVAQNGYVLTFTYEDGMEEKSVHTDFDEVLSIIRSKH